MSPVKRIPVSGEGFKAYEVIVGQGLLTEAETWVGPFLTNRRVVMVTDSNVGPLHADRVLAQFEIAGVKTNIPAIQTILSSEAFASGRVHTGLVPELIS